MDCIIQLTSLATIRCIRTILKGMTNDILRQSTSNVIFDLVVIDLVEVRVVNIFVPNIITGLRHALPDGL